MLFSSMSFQPALHLPILSAPAQPRRSPRKISVLSVPIQFLHSMAVANTAPHSRFRPIISITPLRLPVLPLSARETALPPQLFSLQRHRTDYTSTAGYLPHSLPEASII